MVADYDNGSVATLTKNVASRSLGERGRELPSTVNKSEPMQLLDLPLDVLQAIIREVTHTNDLTALALTHSVLHALVIPHIYSRFDIVWPDGGPAVESRVGVDALTYGLATLVMSQDTFGEGTYMRPLADCGICGSSNFCQHRNTTEQPRKIRRGNNFAQFTRKFSLGNGPEDWVKEYLITKESGKMLGTLAALAIGRMRNLESFTWDMPTGVLRDVWLALASLDNRGDEAQCHLDRVWVRWHDNQDSPASQPTSRGPSGFTNIPHLIAGLGRPMFQIPPYPRVEFPTFSVLPPLRSLSALDIDELSYVEEMSVLVERSLKKLRELRIGLAYHAQERPWARPLEDRTLIPPLPSQIVDQIPRIGGILGILVCRFCPEFNDVATQPNTSQSANREIRFDQSHSALLKDDLIEKPNEHLPELQQDDMRRLGTMLYGQHLDDDPLPAVGGDSHESKRADPVNHTISSPARRDSPAPPTTSNGGYKTLTLDTLELERVHIYVPVLCQALDWSRMRSLTILGCRDHELLWKTLRKTFAPPSQRASLFGRKLSNQGIIEVERDSSQLATLAALRSEYELCITRIHTDAVSTALLAFIKDALAPDSMETLFMQQSTSFKSTVTIDQIYKYAVRRHRGSLRKLLFDSDLRAVDGSSESTSNWSKWAISRELITCITSGRMRLRELSISIDYKDWHYFLQRLPNASTIRSLHIKQIADYAHSRVDAREAAHQVLDIVTLRPDLELCYLGIQNKCFEIIEYPSDRKAPPTPRGSSENVSPPHLDDDDISDDHDDQANNISDSVSDDLNLISDHDDVYETEDEAHQGQPKPALKLREILFYDDKISIFKARHGRL